ncbi:MAG: TIGR00159 family protein, partial [Paraprevotella sp.]|nr:TIGR00159 family protein [Paraprevotella sp.]
MPIDFGIKDFIDIFLVALLLFYCYKVMKESRSLNIFFGVLIFIVFWLFISQVMEMRLLGSVLDKLVSVGALALII